MPEHSCPVEPPKNGAPEQVLIRREELPRIVGETIAEVRELLLRGERLRKKIIRVAQALEAQAPKEIRSAIKDGKAVLGILQGNTCGCPICFGSSHGHGKEHFPTKEAALKAVAALKAQWEGTVEVTVVEFSNYLSVTFAAVHAAD